MVDTPSLLEKQKKCYKCSSLVYEGNTVLFFKDVLILEKEYKGKREREGESEF